MKVDGLKIKIAIAEKGYTIKEFSKICDISPQGLYTIIRDNSTRALTAVNLAKHLGLKTEDLVIKCQEG